MILFLFRYKRFYAVLLIYPISMMGIIIENNCSKSARDHVVFQTTFFENLSRNVGTIREVSSRLELFHMAEHFKSRSQFETET